MLKKLAIVFAVICLLFGYCSYRGYKALKAVAPTYAKSDRQIASWLNDIARIKLPPRVYPILGMKTKGTNGAVTVLAGVGKKAAAPQQPVLSPTSKGMLDQIVPTASLMKVATAQTVLTFSLNATNDSQGIATAVRESIEVPGGKKVVALKSTSPDGKVVSYLVEFGLGGILTVHGEGPEFRRAEFVEVCKRLAASHPGDARLFGK